MQVCCLLQVVKTFQSGKKEGGDFVASWLSPRGAYLYCLGEDGNVFCFETIGKLESVLQVLAIAVHIPSLNVGARQPCGMASAGVSKQQ